MISSGTIDKDMKKNGFGTSFAKNAKNCYIRFL